MTGVDALVRRLEAYFSELALLQTKWQLWISNMELAAAATNSEQLTQLNPAANELFAELQNSIQVRAQILADAKESGLTANSLENLYKKFPTAVKRHLGSGLRKAKRNLNQLRRLHVATWVLINQRSHHYNTVMSLLMQGNATQSVYAGRYQSEERTAPEGGGQLLDTNL